MRSPLAYTPRPGPLQDASVAAAALYLGAPALVAFLFSSPVVLAGAGVAVAVGGLAAGAGTALRASARWGLWLGAVIVAVNALVVDRGATVLVRGYELPLLGPLDVTLESIAAGAVLAERIVVVTMAFAVWSACVDPDRVLRLLRPAARRSALTATLVSRLVPLAAADLSRLREAASLRGPAASTAGRAALARRLLAGSLDRAMDVAATLELRGYALSAPGTIEPLRRSRHDRSFALTGIAIASAAVAARVLGVGAFDAYPELRISLGAATVALAAALPLAAAIPFVRPTASLRGSGRARSRAEGAGAGA